VWKKFAWSIGLALFSLASLGTYYVLGAVDRLPQYRIVAAEGEASIGEGLKLSGVYLDGIYLDGRRLWDSVDITADGSEYDSERPPVRKLVESSWRNAGRPEETARLQQRYRSFMRGKDNWNGLYEDEDVLVYVDAAAGEAALHLDVLDKGTGKRMNRRADIAAFLPEDADPADALQVRDVQRVGEELHVLSLKDARYRIIVLDLADGTALRAFEPDFRAAGFPDDASVHVITEQNRAASARYAVFAYRSPTGQERFASYEYATGGVRLLPAESQRAGVAQVDYALQGRRLVRTMIGWDWIEFLTFDLDSGEIGKFRTEAEAVGARLILDGILADGMAVLLLQEADGYAIVALDAADGSLKFRGEIATDGGLAEADAQPEKLNPFSIEWKVKS
jgi:hypothetical protein